MSSHELFTPLTIANGRIELGHRVVMAPMTRNRGVPFSGSIDNRIWLADEVVARYYAQRASPGGLIITEGIPLSLEASGMPNVPGLFHESQYEGWKKVVQGVHEKGGYIYAQLWHAGRATIPQMTGCPVVSASSVPWSTDETFPFRTPDTKEKIRYRDFPSVAMTEEEIAKTTQDFVKAAEAAIDIGFDGVEINGGNGNLVDQFLHSNLNARTDSYGGSPQARGKFALDLVGALTSAVGPSNVAIRLEPTGLYNETYGAERVETWSHLCEQLALTYQGDKRLSYVHFIEPRLDRVEANKELFSNSWTLLDVSNEHFRAIIKKSGIPCISCGGWDAGNVVGAVKEKGWDAVAFAKWFVSNPDLPRRLLLGKSLKDYDRSRFYGSWDGIRDHGYVDYPTWEEQFVEEAK
ncbi:putative 12-oxophytodienoate reductase [Ilyonectria robusta]|uniref:putative 12-oxophytodienoate reductase n=1 Tax=Ilyonectria robusta TaxID=1079257 RepID=UPI001E8EE6A6|nr:putative 12-oxophytodienoate reductase [Ilyonectria robusta]KAH8675207.1 putative 12-oxophytodienoate reductase [Ilyonectria robusta]